VVVVVVGDVAVDEKDAGIISELQQNMTLYSKIISNNITTTFLLFYVMLFAARCGIILAQVHNLF
jgi:hypothetical protein